MFKGLWAAASQMRLYFYQQTENKAIQRDTWYRKTLTTYNHDGSK
jgi:hypothetical protein